MCIKGRKAIQIPLLLIFENGTILEQIELTDAITFQSISDVVVGGSTVAASIHDIRLWSKAFTPALANVEKDEQLIGREIDLIGYWPMDG